MRKTNSEKLKTEVCFAQRQTVKWQSLDFNYLLARTFQTSIPQNKNATNEVH